MGLPPNGSKLVTRISGREMVKEALTRARYQAIQFISRTVTLQGIP
jgi:hypothetical protein